MARDAARRYLGNMAGELNSAALYQALAGLEKDPRLADLYGKMAAVERGHARAWRKLARDAGADPGDAFTPSLRTRCFIFLARRLGTGFILPSLADLEKKDSGRYRLQPESGSMSRDEAAHTRLLTEMGRTTLRNGPPGDFARLEGRHRFRSGNALRAAVLGANDGLVSNLSLVMGVAGAGTGGGGIAVAGLAGLLAGASSMALGEWLSVQSARELQGRQLELEREEVEATPEAETEELALIYQARGLEEGEARRMAERVMTDTEGAVETMAREELGIDPGELGGSPWTAAALSFLLFALGAAVPVLPFLLAAGKTAIAGSLAASALALFMVGAGITLFTGRGAWLSGLRQVAFGAAAAGATFLAGRWIGAALPG